ncbi:hypothetical protein [Enemella dayhoffiae]|uniref:hypothetical protein n=1 Tax=Enemella dayhoffiae TaxID=2016507 RepID=UPI001594EB11|nr:hypothetical protein [Enemella dayhoffiae]
MPVNLPSQGSPLAAYECSDAAQVNGWWRFEFLGMVPLEFLGMVPPADDEADDDEPEDFPSHTRIWVPNTAA